jgi:uncharacterized protein (TIRG00374 family)
MMFRLGASIWLKAVITVAILVVVPLRVDLSAVAKALRHVNWPLFLLAVGLSFPIGFTAIQRWRYVAATFGEELPLSKAFVYAWIGQFINLGLPTVVGLDSVRAWKMHKQGITIGLATRIVVIDRLCSLFTLLIVIAVAMPHLSALQGSEIFKQSATLAFVLGCAALAGLSAAEFILRANSTTNLVRHLYQLSKDFNHTVFGNAATTFKMSSCSIGNHLGRVAVVFVLAIALGIWVSPFDAFTLVPAALLLAMVPISLAGWGVREVVFIQAFSLAGVAPSNALALSLVYGLVGLITGLLGGAVWFAERRLQRQRIETPPSERHA